MGGDSVWDEEVTNYDKEIRDYGKQMMELQKERNSIPFWNYQAKWIYDLKIKNIQAKQDAVIEKRKKRISYLREANPNLTAKLYGPAPAPLKLPSAEEVGRRLNPDAFARADAEAEDARVKAEQKAKAETEMAKRTKAPTLVPPPVEPEPPPSIPDFDENGWTVIKGKWINQDQYLKTLSPEERAKVEPLLKTNKVKYNDANYQKQKAAGYDDWWSDADIDTSEVLSAGRR